MNATIFSIQTGVLMRGNKSLAFGVAAVTAATLTLTAGVSASPAGASVTPGVPVVTAHVSGGRIVLSSGNTLHAGRITFRVVTGKGLHVLQILRLHRGYTLTQAFSDVNKAFSGDVAAIKRVDTRITWRGGAQARPNQPNWFTVTLGAGTFYFIDQNSNAVRKVTVVGEPRTRPGIVHQSKITAYSYGFESTPETIPATGTTYFFNQSDQPHFLVMQHVKAGTTARQVRHAFNSPGSQPNWVLKGSRQTGVVSPYFGEMLHYSLPRGEYLIVCFWPDDETGMPHAFMGMWKLIHLA